MKKLIALFLIAAPASAYAMGMHGGMNKPGGCSPVLALHLAVALYALLSVLGYWVLQHAAKETGCCVKKAGQTLGWTLLVIGLLGVLCGVANHAKTGMSKKCCPGVEAMEAGKMDEAMPMRHGMEMPREAQQKPPAAPKTK